MSTATKASNALVATVDFYATALGELVAQLAQRDELVRQLGEQLKRAATAPPIPSRAAPLIVAARALRERLVEFGRTGDEAIGRELHALLVEVDKLDGVEAVEVDR